VPCGSTAERKITTLTNAEATAEAAVVAAQGAQGAPEDGVAQEESGAVHPGEGGGENKRLTFWTLPVANLLGIANGDRRPFAELWMGAHPKAPATADVAGIAMPLD